MPLYAVNARKAMDDARTLVQSMGPMEFTSPMAMQLEESYLQKVATSAKPKTLSSNNRRLKSFLEFTKILFAYQAKPYSFKAALANTTAIRLYLVDLADKHLGKTVVDATCSMIQMHRSLAMPSSTPLQRMRSIKFVLDSVQKNTISTDKQAPGLTAKHVTMILDAWGNSSRWDEVMMAAIIGAAFQITLRPIEASSILPQGLWWITWKGEEAQNKMNGRAPPRIHDIAGAIIVIICRKNKQGKVSYLPLPMGKALAAMHRHVLNMRQLCPRADFLFPARMAKGAGPPRYTHHQKARWCPNPRNPFSTASIRNTAIPTALLHCCRIPRKMSQIFSGYSLRVGGSTHHEEAGTAESIRVNLSEWMSLATARHYLQHGPRQQFSYLGAAVL